ncbi:MAG: hypothetical protein LBJ31_02010 [Treponema sp.]|jgi:hypothetical protein|nr:hypothetical protein [Treponema sp.]
MGFAPWENLTFQTNYNKDEIITRLNENVEPKGLFWVYFLKKYSYGKQYQGNINDNLFEIRRVSIFANSFRPIIKGEINEAEDNKTVLNIRIRMHEFVCGFMAVFFGILIINLINSILSLLLRHEYNLPFISIVIAFFTHFLFSLLVYLIMTGLFKYESGKFKKDLKGLFKII